MRFRSLLPVLIGFGFLNSPFCSASKISFDSNGVMEIDGKTTFVISFAMSPPPGGKTPQGKDAFAELRDAGANYIRVSPNSEYEKDVSDKVITFYSTQIGFNDKGMAIVQSYLDAAAEHGMYGWISLIDHGVIKEENAEAQEKKLREIVTRFKDHPANGGWKGSDEPAWGKVPVEQVMRSYRVIKSVDPDHPVFVLHAPETKAPSPAPYMPFCDVTGADIFPIAYPPGRHSDNGNPNLSAVSDITKWIIEQAHGKPVWMTLQIAWSGSSTPVKERSKATQPVGKKTLRFPTFAQERYMTYAAIINGARGINYFGGALPQTLSETDEPLGWNWTFWQRVLKPIVQEIGDKSPLYPALIAPNANLPVEVVEEPAKVGATTLPGKPEEEPLGVEFCVREVGDDIFLLAAKREGATVHVKFSGLGKVQENAPVLFESPRKVEVEDGAFTDWFGPNDVHVYRFKRGR